MKKWLKVNSRTFRNKTKKFKLMLLMGVAAILLLIWIICILSDVYGWKGNGEKVMVNIPDGCTVNQMAQILESEGIIEYPLVFRIYEKMDGVDHLFRMGGHLVEKGMSYKELIIRFSEKPNVELNVPIRVTIPEGFENRQIADRLAEMGLVDKDRFWNELENGVFEHSFVKEISRTENRLEGYLYPATYDFYAGDTEHNIIDKMLDAFEKNVVTLYNSSQTEFSLDEVVTFASVVEREAANDGERPIVASVFYNRTQKDMTWSSCATVQYILKERKAILSTSDTKIESPYNTYINKGLPPGPIACPGLDAIKAALDPAETDYYFFVASSQGTLFSKTYKEHLSNVKKAGNSAYGTSTVS